MNLNRLEHHTFVNRLQTLILITIMMCFLACLGWVLWGLNGLIILIILGLALFILTPTISPHFIMYLYKAERLLPEQVPVLYEMLKELCKRSDLKTFPEIYYIPSEMISVFSVGKREHAYIAITDGFIRTCNFREMVAVFAHEVSHISHNDMRVMSLADLFTRLTSLLSIYGLLLTLFYIPLYLFGMISINWILIFLLIISPTLSALAQLGLSRLREYNADLYAAQLTGDPLGLAYALEKIENRQGGWFERIFLPGYKIKVPSILRTHPPTTERIKRLLSLVDDRAIKALPGFGNAPHPWSRSITRKPRWHLSGLWH